jgi:hypothetical protein
MLEQLRKRELEVIKRQANNSERMTAINAELLRLESVYTDRASYMENCRHLAQEYDTLKGQNEALQNELLWITGQITNIEYGLS